MSDEDPGLSEGGGDPFSEPDAGAADEAVTDDGSGSLFDMLLSTEPPVDPTQAAQEIDSGAGWQGHASAGLQKATGTAGTPAFAHFIMAAVLLLQTVSEDSAEQPDANNGDTLPQENPDSEGDVDVEELNKHGFNL